MEMEAGGGRGRGVRWAGGAGGAGAQRPSSPWLCSQPVRGIQSATQQHRKNTETGQVIFPSRPRALLLEHQLEALLDHRVGKNTAHYPVKRSAPDLTSFGLCFSKWGPETGSLRGPAWGLVVKHAEPRGPGSSGGKTLGLQFTLQRPPAPLSSECARVHIRNDFSDLLTVCASGRSVSPPRGPRPGLFPAGPADQQIVSVFLSTGWQCQNRVWKGGGSLGGGGAGGWGGGHLPRADCLHPNPSPLLGRQRAGGAVPGGLSSQTGGQGRGYGREAPGWRLMDRTALSPPLCSLALG